MKGYEIIVDNRGHAYELIKQYLAAHKKKAEHYRLRTFNNQKWDVLVRETRCGREVALFELKLKDLYNSLVKKTLQKELYDYILFAQRIHCEVYVIAAPTYGVSLSPLHQAFIYIDVMNRFPGVKYWLVSTPKKVIEKMFKVIERPPNAEKIDLPVIKRDMELERFAQSIASLHKGTSYQQAVVIAEGWRADMSIEEFIELVNKAHGDGRNHVKHASDLYEAIHNCWLRK